MPYLYYLILGATPTGRHTEQHDVFFWIGDDLREAVEDIKNFWPEADGKVHVDAWRKVTVADGFEVKISPKKECPAGPRLFFMNLGGYREGRFQEFHEQRLVVASNLAEAVKQVKNSSFYKDFNPNKKASSHIDDKYALDVDDAYKVEDILPVHQQSEYSIELIPTESLSEDPINIGYFKLRDFK